MDSKESTAYYCQLSHLISSQALAFDMLCTSLIASLRHLFSCCGMPTTIWVCPSSGCLPDIKRHRAHGGAIGLLPPLPLLLSLSEK